MERIKRAKASSENDELVRRLCLMDESCDFEFKRVSGKMVHKKYKK